MSLLLITCDNPAGEYAHLKQFAEGFDALRLADNAFAIASELPADELYQRLHPLLHPDETAYILSVTDPWIGFGYEAMNDWLHRHLH